MSKKSVEYEVYDNDDGGFFEEGESLQERVKEKAMWGVFWSAVFFILVIFLALWLFNWYRQWRRQQQLQSVAQGVQNFGRNLIGYFNPANVTSPIPPPQSTLPPVPQTFNNDSNMSNQVMMPAPSMSQPNSPMSDGEMNGLNQAMPQASDVYGSHRLLLWYDGNNMKDAKRMYRDFCRLRDKVRKDRKFRCYGNFDCHKYDVSQPQYAQFYNTLAQNSPALQNAQVPMPMMTYGPANQAGEVPLNPDNAEKDLQGYLESQPQME